MLIFIATLIRRERTHQTSQTHTHTHSAAVKKKNEIVHFGCSCYRFFFSENAATMCDCLSNLSFCRRKTKCINKEMLMCNPFSPLAIAVQPTVRLCVLQIDCIYSTNSVWNFRIIFRTLASFCLSFMCLSNWLQWL